MKTRTTKRIIIVHFSLMALLLITGCNKNISIDSIFSFLVPNSNYDNADFSQYADMTFDEIRTQAESCYSVNICLDTVLEIPSYEIELLKDENLLRKFVILLDQQLALYPKGFFADFSKDNYLLRFFPARSIVNYESGNKLGGTVVFSVGNEFISPVSMFTGEYNNQVQVNIIILANDWINHWNKELQNAGCPYIQYALHHEIGHILETLITFSHQSIFDYDIWYTLLPEGYNYYSTLSWETRLGENQISLYDYSSPYLSEDQHGIWFCDAYAQSNSAEHLASLFAYAMCPIPPETWKAPRVQKQVAYYFPLIREVFGNATWPEITHWEAAQIEAATS